MMNFTKKIAIIFIFLMISLNNFCTTIDIKPKHTNLENQNPIVDPEQEINEAEELFFREDYNLALRKLLRIVKFLKQSQDAENTKNILARAYILLGTYYLRKGNKISAEAYYNEYVKLDSKVKVKKEKYGKYVFQAIEILKKQHIKQDFQAQYNYILYSEKINDKK